MIAAPVPPAVTLRAAARRLRTDGQPLTADLLEAFAVRADEITEATPSERSARAVFLGSATGAGEALALAADQATDTDLLETVLEVPIRFWTCPERGHRVYAGVPTVAWSGGVARCLTPGCDHTNERFHPRA